jgi:hypothetical protein
MQLTDRQLETLADLHRSGYKTPEQVIIWCNSRLKLPRFVSRYHTTRTGRRKHSRQYYKDIIAFLTNSPCGEKGSL